MGSRIGMLKEICQTGTTMRTLAGCIPDEFKETESLRYRRGSSSTPDMGAFETTD
jgi:hypothetical protein